MTSRENRKQRREAERKARKLANKQPHNSPAPPSPSPEPSESRPATAAYLAEMRAKVDRELDEEFGAEFMAHAREVSDRMARRFGLPLWSGSRADVVQPEPRPVVKTAFEIPAPQTPYGTENSIPASHPINHNQKSPENGIPTSIPRGDNQYCPESHISPTGRIGQNQNSSGNAISPTYPTGPETASLPAPKIPTKSTGPRTREGKLASSRNSLKHGLAANVPFIPGEDPAAFETLRTALLHEHQPADATEQILVDQLAQSYWLLQRALRFQNNCFTLGGIDNKVGVDEKRLALFVRYGSTHERVFHKALNTLLRLKRDRRNSQTAPQTGFVSQKHDPPPPEPSPECPMTGFVSQNDPSPELDSEILEPIHTHPKIFPAREKLPDAA